MVQPCEERNDDVIELKGIVFEDFMNYKKCSMFLIFPKCSFKCDKENGNKICQNGKLANSKSYFKSIDGVVSDYINNPITHSVVMGGLEPMDSFDDMVKLIHSLRDKTNDDIVIYTGYTKEEISGKINLLKAFPNIIIKYGRFIPNQSPHYDSVLGVNLASDNQYAEVVS